jgi:hypothetical protein
MSIAGHAPHRSKCGPLISEMGQKPRPSQPRHVSFRRQRTLDRASIRWSCRPTLLRLFSFSWTGCSGRGHPYYRGVSESVRSSSSDKSPEKSESVQLSG